MMPDPLVPAAPFEAPSPGRQTPALPPPPFATLLPALDSLPPDELLSRLRLDQHQQWNAGQAIRAEEYLDAFPALAADPEKALVLIHGEVLLRAARGEVPDLADYQARFPTLAERLALQFQLEFALAADLTDLSVVGSPLPPVPPPRIPGYEVLGEVGRGGMGVVYKARQVGLNRLVALKMILAGPLAKAEHLARFRQEAELTARLHHPNIVQVYEVGSHEGHAWLAMEFVEGSSLAQHIAGTPQLAAASAALVETLAAAVHEAHLKGVVHRDLKPANILMASPSEETATAASGSPLGGRVPKIADFGLARSVQSDSELTVTGMLIGTPCYMAPEQAHGRPRGSEPAADVYSLGAILYELLTGRPPFRGATPMETLDQVRTQEPPPPSRLQPSVPRDLDTIALKCLQKEPGQRYRGAFALAEDLRRFREGRPIAARPVGALERGWRWCRRNPAWAATIALTTGLLLVIAAGSSLAVVLLEAALAESEGHRQRAEAAEAEAERQLDLLNKAGDDLRSEHAKARWMMTRAQLQARLASERRYDALLAQSTSIRLGPRSGRRFRSLEVLADAAKLGRELVLLPERFDEARDEATAALALSDLWVRRWWDGFPAGSSRLDFDDSLATYARTDTEGGCTVRRVTNDAELCRLPPPEDGVPAGTAVYPFLHGDGRHLAVHVPGRSLRLWRRDGARTELVLAAANVARFAFHPREARAAVGSLDGSVTIHELPDGREVAKIKLGEATPVGIALHPTEPLLALSIAPRGAVRLQDSRTREVVSELPGEGFRSLAWHPDGRLLAAANHNGVVLFDGPNYTRPRKLDLGMSPALLAFNPAGDRLAAAGAGNDVRLVDVESGRTLVHLPAAKVPTSRLRFDGEGRRLAAAVEKGRVGVWEVADAREFRTWTPPTEADFATVAVSSAEPRLLVVAHPDRLRFWDVATGREVAAVPTGLVRKAVFASSGALFTTGPEGTHRWPVLRAKADTGTLRVGPPERLALPPGRNLDASADGRVLVVAGLSGKPGEETAGGWVTGDDGDAPRRIDRRTDLRHVAVSPDGRWLATAPDPPGRIKLWDPRTDKLVKELPASGTGLGFSPDSHWLAVSGEKGHLFRVGTWEEGPSFGGRAAFSPDGRLMAVETLAGCFRLVETETGQELARLSDPDQEVTTRHAFTPDGTRLAAISGGARRGLHVWDLRRLRMQLDKLGLDWHAPSDPRGPSAVPPPLRVVVEPTRPTP